MDIIHQLFQGYFMSTIIDEAYQLYNDRKFKEVFDLIFDEAAYKNDGEAQYLLGKLYYDGDGVEQSEDNAIKWWTRARRNGQRDAAYQMAQLRVSTKNIF